MDLMTASHQWAMRQLDERYWDVEPGFEAAKRHRAESRHATLPLSSLRVEASDGDLLLVGKSNIPASFTNFSFEQLCSTVKAPPDFLTQLPATLAAQNMNHQLKKADDREVNLLFRQNGNLSLQCTAGPGYSRIWNADFLYRMVQLKDNGWRVPPARPAMDDPRARPATIDDVLRDQGHGLSVKVGDMIAPAGVYVSDRDCFVFMVKEGNLLDAGGGRSLTKAFCGCNAERPGMALWLQECVIDHVCGNHIMWGARDVTEIRVRHVGDASERWLVEVAEQLDDDDNAGDIERGIRAARSAVIAASKDELLDKLFGLKALGLSRTVIGEAYQVAEEKESAYGNPRSVWGMVNGLTEVSQREAFTDRRVRLDRAAGKLMSMAF